ncbi:hypothetical protein DL770_004327 [Monosporascus sp. CRB-9-2]|nr:hypothetical protein DL770_004327 [Monosporascus sp. CRB-9-2]
MTPQPGEARFVDQLEDKLLNALRSAPRPRRIKLNLKEVDLVATEMVYGQTGARISDSDSAQTTLLPSSSVVVLRGQIKWNSVMPAGFASTSATRSWG